MSQPRPSKSLSRSLGEFLGHIWHAVRADPAEAEPDRREVRRTVEERRDGDMVLRRTTIEEIEFRRSQDPPTP